MKHPTLPSVDDASEALTERPVAREPDAAGVAKFARALEDATALTGVKADPVELRRTVRNHLAAHQGEAPLSQLAGAARAAGLRTTAHRAPLDDALAGGVPMPALLWLETGECLVLESVRLGHVRVLRSDGAPADLMTGPSLATALGVSTGRPLDWLSVTPAQPLAELEGAHGHHPSPWQRVRRLVSIASDDLGVVLVYSVAIGVLSLATPIAVQSLVNTVAFGSLLQPIVVLALLFFVAVSFAAVLRALESVVVETLQQRLFVRSALDLGYRLPRVRIEAYDGKHGPELANRFFDVVTVQKAAATLLLEGTALVLQAGIGMLVLAFYHPYLLAFDVVLLGAAALVIFGMSRSGVATALDESYAKYGVAAWIQELARGVSTFRTTGGNAVAVEHAEALVRRYLSARRSHYRVVLRQTVGVLATQVIATSALLAIGGYLVIDKQLTLGQLVAAELIVAAVTASLTKFGKILENTYDLVAAADKLGHLVDLPLEAGEGAEVLPSGGGLSVKADGVTVSRDGYVSEPLRFDFTPGERAAVVFDEGPARVALAELLAGLRAPTSGLLTFDGVRPDQADGHAVGDRVAFVRSHDVFAGSIAENVALGRLDVGPAEVRAALERVGLLEFIQRLEAGVDTQLTPTGSPLSDGQVVLLMVARTLAARPRMVVVDAPIDALSPDVRTRVIGALTDPAAPWTLVALVGDADGPLGRACGRRLRSNALAAGESAP
ncbi:MAG: ATP-binding cassette domain-containing protein [Archangium sp.]|nr:ATP-binding cassette domain-containing protein [Archangium sp.]